MEQESAGPPTRQAGRPTGPPSLAILVCVVWSLHCSLLTVYARILSLCPLENAVFFLFNHRARLALLLILAIHGGLGWWGIQNMGVVGEVAWTWMNGDPSAHHALPLETHRFGPFEAASTRPVESLIVGDFRLPLAVNHYTGGIADWPARTMAAIGLSYQSTAMLHLLLGAVLIALVHRFVRTHGSAISANAAALLLATDWVYIFFRRTLGGTELLLSAASLLCLWALWSRRWGGGRHGLTALALGIGLGMVAKFTFALSVAALAITALVMRWDKPALRPPLPSRWFPVGLALLIPMIPMAITAAHHAGAGLTALSTHDQLFLQFERVMDALNGTQRPARESAASLLAWLGDGTAFLGTAWGAEAPSWASPLRALGWAVLSVGTISAWRDQNRTPRLALARFCSVFVPLQVAMIWIVARDLHHLAIATPGLMIWAGLCTEAAFGHFAPPRSMRRAAAVCLGCLPWIIGGTRSVIATDSILSSIPRPTVSLDGQHALIESLQKNGVGRVMTLDYEAAGALDILAPQITFSHGWARIVQDRSTALDELLVEAAGGHLLVLPGSPPWSYNLRPRAADLAQAGERAGVVSVEVDRLPDGAAVLYAVDWRKGQP